MRSALCFTFSVLLTLCGLCLSGPPAQTVVDVRRSTFATHSDLAPLIVMIGESNSGGYADNTDASPSELAPRSCVQILNNRSLQFEDLQIGRNNLIDHAGLTEPTHGWELQIANSVEAGAWGASTVYLVKAGQGGSKLAEWNRDGEYFRKFCSRIHAARENLRAMGKTPVVFVFGSIGINDHLAGTPVSEYQRGLNNWLSSIRSIVGDVPVILTDFMPQYDDYNRVVAEVETLPNTFHVRTRGATLRDRNHWNYEGCKTVAGRLIRAAMQSPGFELR